MNEETAAGASAGLASGPLGTSAPGPAGDQVSARIAIPVSDDRGPAGPSVTPGARRGGPAEHLSFSHDHPTDAQGVLP